MNPHDLGIKAAALALLENCGIGETTETESGHVHCFECSDAGTIAAHIIEAYLEAAIGAVVPAIMAEVLKSQSEGETKH